MIRLHVGGICAVLACAAVAQESKPPSIPDWASLESNISYGEYKETVLDIVQPKAASQKKRPGVLVIHGGGWVSGTKESQIQSRCLRFVEKGFVCANVEYRLAKTAPAPAAVTDVLNAAQWFEHNAKKYNIDTRRIIVTGGSAGGHLALMVGMASKSAKLGPPARIAAVVNFYGITDVADLL